MKAVQKEREEKLARLLKDFLNQYVQGEKRGFLHHAEFEAKRLSGAGLLFKQAYRINVDNNHSFILAVLLYILL